MGIKFICDQCGEELNVKSTLAGRKGLCPKCNAKILVPGTKTSPKTPSNGNAGTVKSKSGKSSSFETKPSSAATSGSPKEAAVATGKRNEPSFPVAGVRSPDQVPVEAIESVEAVEAVAEATPVFVPSGTERKTTGSPVTVAPEAVAPLTSPVLPKNSAVAAAAPIQAIAANVPTTMPAASPPRVEPVTVDPLAEDPTAVWYVRPPGGGQFGPASNDLMKQWLQDERVGENSLVWRDGWADWLNAGQVFPQLGAATQSPAVAEEVAAGGLSGWGPQAGITSNAKAKKIEYYRNRKRRATMGITIIFVGITTIAALIAILGFILTR